METLINPEELYLQFDDMSPELIEELRLRGLTKLLLTRCETIHLKHLMTEVFVRKKPGLYFRYRKIYDA